MGNGDRIVMAWALDVMLMFENARICFEKNDMIYICSCFSCLNILHGVWWFLKVWFRRKKLRTCEDDKWAAIMTLVTFHYFGWFTGILVLASYNPYITESRIIPYTFQPTRCFFLSQLFTPSFFGQIAKLGAEKSPANRLSLGWSGCFHNHGNPHFQWFVITKISRYFQKRFNDSSFIFFMGIWCPREFGILIEYKDYMTICIWLCSVCGYISMYCRVPIFDFT